MRPTQICFFAQICNPEQNMNNFPFKSDMCHCTNWQTQLALVIPAHLDYFLLRMLRKEKLCGEEQGQDADICR